MSIQRFSQSGLRGAKLKYFTTISQSAPPSLWTPAEITTQVWLDASDSAELTLNGTNVTSWNNKSGGTDFAQATASRQPTYLSSIDAVEFDGTDDYLSAATNFGNGGNQNFMCVCVIDYQSLSTVSDRLFQYGNGQSSGVNSIGGGTSGVGWNWRHNNGFSAHTNITTAQKYLTSWVRSAGTTYADDEMWANGTQQSRSSGSTSNSTNITTDFTSLGYGIAGGGTEYYSNARVYEIVVARLDDATNRQLLEGYMAWKWGMEGSLPSGHPYKSAAPTV